MKWLKLGSVIFGALMITALGIDAADTLSGSRSTLLGQLISSEEKLNCDEGMIETKIGQSFTCVDMYEVGADALCPHPNPLNELETKANLESEVCRASSNKGVEPWRFITREQASLACLKAGKRLPTSAEWNLLSVGTPDNETVCNINASAVVKTGQNSKCISTLGVFDTIGNVWEWTSDDVINGVYNGRELPLSGYVAQVDTNGVATLTNLTAPSDLFYKDYFWSSKEGAYGIMRGGFYGSKSDAGVYAVHAQTLPTAAGTAIGFRCIK
jgi:hypothetical protein